MAVPMVTTASFTRPADTTQYAVGDLVANSTTAGSVAAMQFAGGPTVIRRARLTKSDDDVTAATFRVHLFSSDPTATAPANGDNGAISLNTAIADYLGSFSFDMTASPDIYNTAGNVAVGVPVIGNEVMVPWTGSVYGLLEVRGTYTPASAEVFTVDLEYFAGS